MGIDINRLIPPALQRSAPEDYDLWPEHEAAWRVYLGCNSQWRIAVGMGGALWLGLDYTGLQAVMRMYGVPAADRAEVFQQVQILEDAELVLRNDL